MTISSNNFEPRDDYERDVGKRFGYADAINIISEKRKAEMWGAITDILLGKKTIHFHSGKIEIR